MIGRRIFSGAATAHQSRQALEQRHHLDEGDTCLDRLIMSHPGCAGSARNVHKTLRRREIMHMGWTVPAACCTLGDASSSFSMLWASNAGDMCARRCGHHHMVKSARLREAPRETICLVSPADRVSKQQSAVIWRLRRRPMKAGWTKRRPWPVRCRSTDAADTRCI